MSCLQGSFEGIYEKKLRNFTLGSLPFEWWNVHLNPLIPRDIPSPGKFLIASLQIVLKPYIDFVDIIYGQAFNNLFRWESDIIQYNAGLTIASPIRGTKIEILNKELSLETLHQRKYFR